MNPNSDYNTAVHEAAHAIAADFYGVPNFPELTPGGFSKVKQSTEPGTAGLCHLEPPFTKYQDCVISWAGIIGECLFGTAPFWAPQFKPSEKMLRDFWMMATHQIKKLSDTDRLGILGDYKHSWRACRSAFRIVRKNRVRILRLAKAIAGRFEKPVPMPETFPATFADFLRVVVTGDNAEIKLRAFVSDQTEKFFTGGQFAFDTPEQRQQVIESWTSARLAKYETGFADPDSWQNAALPFRAWKKTTPSTSPAP